MADTERSRRQQNKLTRTIVPPLWDLGHNAYDVLMGGKVSMREHHSFKSMDTVKIM